VLHVPVNWLAIFVYQEMLPAKREETGIVIVKKDISSVKMEFVVNKTVALVPVT